MKGPPSCGRANYSTPAGHPNVVEVANISGERLPFGSPKKDCQRLYWRYCASVAYGALLINDFTSVWLWAMRGPG